MPKLTPAQMKAAVEEFKKKFTPGYYHGSPNPNITAFDPMKSTVRDVDFVTPGVTFVTKSPKFADSFTSGKGPYISLKTGEAIPSGSYNKGSTMYPVSVDMTNHFNPATPEGRALVEAYVAKKYADDPKMARQFKMRIEDPHSNWTTMESPAFLQHLRESGIKTFDVNESGYQNVGVLDPSKIRGKFAKYNPEDAELPEFMKAAGGAIKSGLAALKRHPHGQDPKVAKALEEYLKGNISQEERLRILNQQLPIRKWSELPPDYTDEQIINALMANKQAKALVPVATGARVGNRLDIPAYTQHGVYVDTTHDIAGKPISYGRTGHLKDVEFSSKPNQAVRVGLGTKEQALTPLGAEMGAAKSPFALIKGTNVGTKDEEVRRMMAELLNDPSYTQIGMDPRRHSQFYDKSTGLPVWRAEEKMQSGPLILAPRKGLEITDWNDPRLELTDFPGKRYAAGGAAKKVLEHARSLPFVHFSKAPSITYLEPGMYGTGIKGAEASRLANAPDIKPRSYFYVDKPGVRPEQGLGPHKYQGIAEGIYPLHEDPMGFSAIAKQKSLDPYLMSQGIQQVNEAQHLNELERLIKQAGYRGYANDDVGLLFERTPVKKAVEEKAGGGKIGALESLAKKILPAAEREANKAKFLEGSVINTPMYHGTSADFTQFKPKVSEATFVTPDPSFASEFANLDELTRSQAFKIPIHKLPTNQNVMKVFVNSKNPFDYENPEHVKNAYNKLTSKQKQKININDIASGDWKTIESKPVQTAIKKLGHDSFQINAVDHKSLGIYDPTKIKSATGNVGTYDPLDPDITKKEGGSI